MAGTNFGEFGEFRQNSPKLVPAKFEYFTHSPNKFSPKLNFEKNDDVSILWPKAENFT